MFRTILVHHQEQLYKLYIAFGRGTRRRSWLRHCATSRKVAGSIPDCVTGIFHWHNPSGSTMALGSTQPLTEMSTRNTSCGVKAAGADNRTTFMCRLSWNLGASTSLNPQGLSTLVMGLFCLFSSISSSSNSINSSSIISSNSSSRIYISTKNVRISSSVFNTIYAVAQLWIASHCSSKLHKH